MTQDVENSTPSIQITNDQFLRGIFGDRWKDALVCAIEDDPNLPSANWTAHWAGDYIQNCAMTRNTFYVVSLFDKGDGKSALRRKDMHEATYVVVFDDVGDPDTTSAKIPVNKVLAHERSTYSLETSPGNFQIGFKLTVPCDERYLVDYLLAEIVQKISLDGTDPGMLGVTRYVRLPVGTNRKKKYMKGNHLPLHVLHKWVPSNTVTMDELAKWYGIDMSLAADAAATRASLDEGELDPVVVCLTALGRVQRVKNSVVIDVDCPWDDTHTDGRKDGAAYLSPGGYHCNHGHCVDKKYPDLLAWLTTNHPDEWEQAVRETAGSQFDAIEGDVRSSVPPVVPGDTEGIFEGLSSVAEKTKFSDMFSGSDIKGPTLDGQWLLKGLFPERGSCVLYGPPKCGKTFVCLDMSCHIAAGMDWYGYRLKRTGFVVYVSSEGGRLAAENRIWAWKQDRLPKGANLDHMLIWPGRLRMGKEAVKDAELLRDYIKDLEAAKGEKCVMVVVDTVNKNLDGDENSTAEMTGYLNEADKIWRGLGCILLHVHHTGKDKDKGSRGSNTLPGDVEAEIMLDRDKSQGLTLPGEMRLVNSRVALDGVAQGYQLRSVVLGRDADGDEVTSVVVDRCKTPTAGAAGVLSQFKGPVQKKLIKIVRDLTTDSPFSEVLFKDVLVELGINSKSPTYKGVTKAWGKLIDDGGIIESSTGFSLISDT